MTKISWHIRYASGASRKMSETDEILYYYTNNGYHIKVAYDLNRKPKWYTVVSNTGETIGGAVLLKEAKDIALYWMTAK